MKRDKRLENLIMFLGLLIVCILVFWNFMFGNKLFVYTDTNDDTFQSYLPTFQLIVNRLKNGQFSTMALNSGLGENIFTFQKDICDPFMIIIYLFGFIFGIEKMAYALVYVHIIKIICAAFACKYVLDYFQFNSYLNVIVSMLYALSAYTLGDMGQHYCFATTLVFVSIAYGLVLRIKDDTKLAVPFMLLVFIICIWSVYFAFMILVASAILFSIQLVSIDDKNSRRRYFTTVAVSVIIGIVLGAFAFFPSAASILLSSDRVNDGISLGTKIKAAFGVFSIEEYRDIILRFFSNQLGGTINNWRGYNTPFDSEHVFLSALFPVSFLACLFDCISKRKSKLKFILLIIFLAVVFTPFTGTFFNIFVEYSPRYLFVLFPFMAYLLVMYLDNLMRGNRTYASVYFFVIIISIVMFNRADSGARISMVIVIVELVAILALSIFRNRINEYVWILCVGIITILSNAIDGRISIEHDRGYVTKEWYVENGMNRWVDYAVKQTNAEGDSFWRMERFYLGWGIQTAPNYSKVGNYRGVSYYNSLASPYLSDFKRELAGVFYDTKTSAKYAMGGFGYPSDSVVSSIYGLKYVVSDYPIDDEDWKLTEMIEDRYLYRNTKIDYAGLLFDKYCVEKDVENYSDIEKQQVISAAVVLDDSISDLEMICSDMLDSRITTEAISSSITKIDATEELSLPVTVKNSGRKWIRLNLKAKDSGTLTCMFDTGFGFNDLFWENNSAEYNSGNNSLLLRMPNDAKVLKTIPTTDIELESIEILSDDNVDFINEGIILDNPNMGNTITGTVNTDKARILLLPILYDRNWTVMLDDKKVDYYKADYSFVGIVIPEGNHRLTVEYICPGLKLGIVVSIVGGVLFIMWLYYIYSRSKENIRNN